MLVDAMMHRTGAAVGLLALLATLGWAAPVHEKGVLELARRELAAGDTVAVAGRKFAPNGRLTLTLVGTGGRTVLGEVSADAAGAFQANVWLPAGIPSGSYRLVAVAADGEEVASLDIVLSAPAMTQQHGLGEHGADTGADQAMPSAQPLRLERARSPAVTGTAIAGIILMLGLAGIWFRRPRHPDQPSTTD